jgi:hypothetical protein
MRFQRMVAKAAGVTSCKTCTSDVASKS